MASACPGRANNLRRTVPVISLRPELQRASSALHKGWPWSLDPPTSASSCSPICSQSSNGRWRMRNLALNNLKNGPQHLVSTGVWAGSPGGALGSWRSKNNETPRRLVAVSLSLISTCSVRLWCCWRSSCPMSRGAARQDLCASGLLLRLAQCRLRVSKRLLCLARVLNVLQLNVTWLWHEHMVAELSEGPQPRLLVLLQ